MIFGMLRTMHVRSSHVRGMPVVEESSQQLLGVLSEPLIDPDTGKIHGFFVLSALPNTEAHLFLQSIDILSWGTKVHVRDAEHLTPPHELVRFEDAFAEQRTIVGQPIRARPGRIWIGRCVDLQFDTKTLLIEWLFPQKFFWMGDPIPTTEILEVTRNAIWIKNPLQPKKMERRQMKNDVLLANTGISDVTSSTTRVVELT